MPKCGFSKVALQVCFHVNLLHIFVTPFTKNTSGWLFLKCIKQRFCIPGS